MNKIGFLAPVFLVLLAATACKPQPQPTDTAPASTDAPPPQPIPEPAPTDAISTVDNRGGIEITAASGDKLDNKSLAGRYSDGESVLELNADGDYAQTLRVAGNDIGSNGHWSSGGGSAILLDPDSKSAEDARFEVLSADVLKGIDGREFKRIAE